MVSTLSGENFSLYRDKLKIKVQSKDLDRFRIKFAMFRFTCEPNQFSLLRVLFHRPGVNYQLENESDALNLAQHYSKRIQRWIYPKNMRLVRVETKETDFRRTFIALANVESAMRSFSWTSGSTKRLSTFFRGFEIFPSTVAVAAANACVVSSNFSKCFNFKLKSNEIKIYSSNHLRTVRSFRYYMLAAFSGDSKSA